MEEPLKRRVELFNSRELPGQIGDTPMVVHRLVNDLSDRIDWLTEVLRSGADITSGTWDGVYEIDDVIAWVKDAEAALSGTQVSRLSKPSTTSSLDQPAPVSNGGMPLWEQVIADMRERDAVGRQRYGMPLQAHNGRHALTDAYCEALDMAVYLKQAIVERNASATADSPVGASTPNPPVKG